MPCAAAEGVAKRFLTRCSRCLNGAANYVCLACWMGVVAAAKSYISKKQSTFQPLQHPVLEALVGVDFGVLNECASGDGALAGTAFEALAVAADGSCLEWQCGCPMCYDLEMPSPLPALPPDARDATAVVEEHVVLRDTIRALNDYGQEHKRKVSCSLEPAPCSSPACPAA